MSVSHARRLVSLTVVLAVATAASSWMDPRRRDPLPDRPSPAAAGAPARLGALPLAFVENRGQWPGPAQFVVRQGRMTVHLAPQAWVLDLKGTRQNAAVRLEFERARHEARFVGEHELPGRHHFFRGEMASWRTQVRAFAALRCRDLYPGVDVVVRDQAGTVEYDLLLAPGADLDRVAVRCDGQQGLAIAPDGSLVLATALGPIRQKPPATWEILAGGERRPVRCEYRLLDGQRYGFAVPQRDLSRPLVIDPGLEWSTYLGGSGGDAAARLVRDAATGELIVFGGTSSFDYPVTTGAYDTTYDGLDATLSRLSADGTKLLWATYLGGSDLEYGYGLVQERTGSLVVAGLTASKATPTTFPTTTFALQTSHGGGVLDGFVSRISADGSRLLYSSYLGGSANDWALDVDVDLAGIVTLVGVTRSPNFWTTPSAYDTTYNGSALSPLDAFVTRLRLVGSGPNDLVASTYLGGTGEEGDPYQPANLNLPGMREISVVSRGGGETTVSGRTKSTDFPTTTGAYDTSHNGGADLFVCRLDGQLSTLRWSTFLGGSQDDGRAALAVDRAGGVVVAGFTFSGNYPTLPGAIDTTFNGSADAFVSRLDGSGSSLLYSTYLGGPGPDELDTVSIDSGGTVSAAGTAADGFPVTHGAYDTLWDGGPKDGVLVRLRTDGKGSRDLHYATWIGGSQDETVWGGAWDDVSAFYAFGVTSSDQFPTTQGAWDRSYGGSYDQFVSKVELLPMGAGVLGKASQGCAGQVAAGVTSMPRIGNASFAVTCTGAQAKAPLLLLLGAGALQTPLPVPTLGIDLWLDPTRLALVLGTASDTLGYAEVALPIPADQGLAGVCLYGQLLGPDLCRPQGFLASNGLELVLQP